MTTKNNRFNLVDEPWIPIVADKKASLRDVFGMVELPALGGNPVQKIALLKLLLAIAQAACTPADDTEWKDLGSEGLAARCLAYLDEWRGSFYLYGPQPFLQMPGIEAAALQSYGAVLPEIASGNSTVLSQSQISRPLDDAEKAVLLVQLMGFALGGKKTDNSVVLTPGYTGKFNDKGKSSTGRAGPSVAHMGLLHCALVGPSLKETIWLNLFTQEHISSRPVFSSGKGTAPWEKMPTGEACLVAQELQQSLMGRLIPLSRFILLTEKGLHYSEGIRHLDYRDGMQDPSVAVDSNSKKIKALWVNPEKRPWRELTGLLTFLSQQKSQGFSCWQLEACMPRLGNAVTTFGIWCGGLRVSSNAGEQYVSGTDDMVESQIWLENAVLNQTWFLTLQQEMDFLNIQAKKLYGCVMSYLKKQSVAGEHTAAHATALFWQQCESQFSTLLHYCGPSLDDSYARQKWRKQCTEMVQAVYNSMCPNTSSRQMDAWAACRPR